MTFVFNRDIHKITQKIFFMFFHLLKCLNYFNIFFNNEMNN